MQCDKPPGRVVGDLLVEQATQTDGEMFFPQGDTKSQATTSTDAALPVETTLAQAVKFGRHDQVAQAVWHRLAKIAIHDQNDHLQALILAAKSGDVNVLHCLLSLALHESTHHCIDPLIAAIKGRHESAVRVLVNVYRDRLNQCDKKGWSPLMYAADAESPEILRLLLLEGALKHEDDREEIRLETESRVNALLGNMVPDTKRKRCDADPAKSESEESGDEGNSTGHVSAADEITMQTYDLPRAPDCDTTAQVLQQKASHVRVPFMRLLDEARLAGVLFPRITGQPQKPKGWITCKECEDAAAKGETPSLEVTKHIGWMIRSLDNKDEPLRATCHAIVVPPSSEEYLNVKREFDRQTTSLILMNVWRVQNHEIHLAYEMERAKMIFRGQAPNERIGLYHTTRGTLEHILAEGMDNRVGSQGLLGNGIYATDSILKASAYWKLPFNRRTMLQVSMLLGNCEEVPDGESRRQLRRESRGYDSLKGRFTGQDEFVVFDRHRVKIDFIIDYEVTPGYVAEASSIIQLKQAVKPQTQPSVPSVATQLLSLSQPQTHHNFSGQTTAGGLATFQTPSLPPPSVPHTPVLQQQSNTPTSVLLHSGSSIPAVPMMTIPDCLANAQSHRLPPNGVKCVAVSQSGRVIVSGTHGGNMHLWEASESSWMDGCTKFAYRGCMMESGSAISSIALDPDGMVAAVSSADSVIRLVDLQKLATQYTLAQTDSERREASRISIKRHLQGHKNSVNSVVFSHVHKAMLASGSSDEKVCLWRDDSNVPWHTLSAQFGVVRTVVFSKDDTRLASGSDDADVCVYEVLPSVKQDPLILRGHTQPVYSVDFSPNRTWLLSASHDRSVRLWNTNTGACSCVFSYEDKRIVAVAFAPRSNDIFLTSHESGKLCLWNALFGSKPRASLMHHSACVNAAVFTPDGKNILSASDDKTVLISSTETHLRFNTILHHEVQSAAPSTTSMVRTDVTVTAQTPVSTAAAAAATTDSSDEEELCDEEQEDDDTSDDGF